SDRGLALADVTHDIAVSLGGRASAAQRRVPKVCQRHGVAGAAGNAGRVGGGAHRGWVAGDGGAEPNAARRAERDGGHVEQVATADAVLAEACRVLRVDAIGDVEYERVELVRDVEQIDVARFFDAGE